MNDPDFKRELRSYLTGFGLALTLTLIPFGFVFHGGLAQGTVLMDYLNSYPRDKVTGTIFCWLPSWAG